MVKKADKMSPKKYQQYNAAVFSSNDFSLARKSWKLDLCGNESTNNIQIAGMQNLLKMRDEDSEDIRQRMNRGNKIPILFGDKAPSESASLKIQYDLILRMALPYGTYGCKNYRSDKLLEDVLYALEWMHDNMYGENVLSDESFRSYTLFDWWDWYVGAASSLMDILMIIDGDISHESIEKYVLPISFLRTIMRTEQTPSAAMSRIVVLLPLSLLTDDRVLLQSVYNDCKILLQNHDSGDNMRRDWCCMTHAMPYNVGYGFLNLSRIAKNVQVLSKTPLAFTLADKYNLMNMVRYTFAPVMYRGKTLNFMSGRIMQLDNSAAPLLSEFHWLRGIFGEEEDRELCEIIHQHNTEDIKKMLVSSYDSHITLSQYREINPGEGRMSELPKTHIASYGWYMDALTNNKYKTNPRNMGYMWYSGDCCVQHRGGNMAGLRMNSERTPAYESTHHFNTDGWYTGDGALYIYTPLSDKQYSPEWWQCADKHLIPGTTVDKRTREKMSFEHSWHSNQSFVGGVTLGEQFVTASMDYEGFHNETDYGSDDNGYGRGWPVHKCTLTAKKSYFFMDKSIVALGCNINAFDGYGVHTVVLNHMLNESDNFITVNGKQSEIQIGEHTSDSVHSIQIPTAGGIIFPSGGNITIKTYENKEKKFISVCIEHGINPQDESYAYILLPGISLPEMSVYDETDIKIISNNGIVQSVTETSSVLTGTVFRHAATSGIITAHTPMITMTQEENNTLSLSVCEPTQCKDNFSFVINSAKNATTKDSCIQIEKIADVTNVNINCDYPRGRRYEIEICRKDR